MKELFVIGIGPGNTACLTIEAKEALEACDVIAGYTSYVNLIKDSFPDKEFYATGMRQESERCEEALKRADEGKRVALICSGDAGVYGMASPVLEIAGNHPDVSINIVPGVTAALSGSARLGAAVAHDFCVISLSDLLTPWEVIENRLKAAAMADFVVVLYNPESKTRKGYLKKACEIMLGSKSGDTVCGYVRNIARDGEETVILTLDELKDAEVDMFTTVFVGNSRTYEANGRMITPRGYRFE